MTEHLVCAACSRPVAEGRCPTCRASRASRQQSGPDAWLTPELLVLLIGLVAILSVVLSHLVR